MKFYGLVLIGLIGIGIKYYLGEMSSVGKGIERVRRNPKPFPAFFVSHGGPSFMYQDNPLSDKGAWTKIRAIGGQIKSWQPDYILVVSAHWQSSGSQLVEISIPEDASEDNELIYDFYGFPRYMYEEQFRSNGSSFVADQVKEQVERAGLSAQLTRRGLDHGVWVPFKVAFSDHNAFSSSYDKGELDLPKTRLIQVSLTGNEKDFDTHYKLGEVLKHFRENLIWDERSQKYLSGLVVCSGMSVHNLRDLRVAFRDPGEVMPYVGPFNNLLTKILTSSKDLLSDLNTLKTDHKELLYRAHPSLEHFTPVTVACGVVGSSSAIKELYTANVGSLGWGIYQFGPDYRP
ncbi:Piso0_004893 [Millerozyma farinosa CBS 7064]|uniref:Piso0_004893 protein n=1 Tax=Pichia sorbitophila (strain ATCC MYA-4447 / BCRC 22081 / CBS 7064 / NBRC 10061 / NRRL Y-12695) TaxID=559304 RepID=G8Y3N9_PICSO|nr:Piso0_004893 [Millerozyma farinosa CBS 7064]